MTEQQIIEAWRFLWSGKALCRHCCLSISEHRPESQSWEFGYKFSPRVPVEQWPQEVRTIAATELQRVEAAE
jgi:hypothetical protein